MDGEERRHHQYGQPPAYPNPSSAPTNPAQQMPPPPPSTETYTQPSARAGSSRSMLNRYQAPGSGGYGFTDQQYTASALQGGSMQGVEMQYSSSYVQDSSRPHTITHQTQPQQYSAYGQGVMMQPAPSPNVYESVPQFQQRQTGALETIPDRFGNPSFLPSNVQGTMAPPPYVNSQPEQVAFQSTLHHPRPAASHGNSQQAGTVPILDQPYASESQSATSATEALEERQQQYQHQLKLTFRAIRAGKVNEASESLIRISNWLLTSVDALGLHHDDLDEYPARLEMWREFNLCWEALGLKQKDIFEEALRSGQPPPDMLTEDRLREMVESLVSLCDSIEHHGLVDYDLGVWEEQIVHIFTQCLDLFTPATTTPQNP